MFSRESQQPEIGTLIDESVRIGGDLEFSGGLHLDGRIAGSVRADPGSRSSLTVSETGYVGGDVEAVHVKLNGTVNGHVRATGRVILGSAAQVHGDVFYQVIEMQLGARIMGRLTRVEAAAPVAGRGDATP